MKKVTLFHHNISHITLKIQQYLYACVLYTQQLRYRINNRDNQI